MRALVLTSVLALAALLPACSPSPSPVRSLPPGQVPRAVADDPAQEEAAGRADAPLRGERAGLARLKPVFW